MKQIEKVEFAVYDADLGHVESWFSPGDGSEDVCRARALEMAAFLKGARVEKHTYYHIDDELIWLDERDAA